MTDQGHRRLPARAARPIGRRLRLSGVWRRLLSFRGANDGVSALEFGLLAPILFFGLVATADIGLALYERMTIDHVLRAGAQSAIADPGREAVRNVLQATATKNFAVATAVAEGNDDKLAVAADRYCACAESPGVQVPCSTTCAGSKPTFIYYGLSANKTYTGMIIPKMQFSPSMQVQIR